MAEFVFSTCCESLDAEHVCSRAEEFDFKVHQVKGLSAFLSFCKEIQGNSCFSKDGIHVTGKLQRLQSLHFKQTPQLFS